LNAAKTLLFVQDVGCDRLFIASTGTTWPPCVECLVCV